MGLIVAIGEIGEIEGFALAGVEIQPAADPPAARARWEGLGGDVSLVVLTSSAAAAIGELPGPDGLLRVTMPEPA